MLHKTGIVCKSLVEATPILNRKLCRFADPAERECKACHTGDLQNSLKSILISEQYINYIVKLIHITKMYIFCQSLSIYI